MKKAVLLAGLLGILVLPVDSAQAQATRTWVSGVGDDVNPCSRTAPCKTFAGAISKTAAGGEINCLDPGGFGTLTITKSIVVDCGGTFGSTLNSGGINGFNINDSATGSPRTIDVVLRNLSIDGAGTTPGLNGIRFISGRSLTVENVVIQNQNLSTGSGISVAATGVALIAATNVSFNGMRTGVQLTTTSGAVVANISNAKFLNNIFNAVDVGAGSLATVRNSVFAAHNGTAILASTATSTVYADENVISNSAVGMSANVSGAKLHASGNKLYGNSKAINVAAGGIFLSGNDNKIDINPGNPSTGAMTVR
jgi:hypothetical protein